MDKSKPNANLDKNVINDFGREWNQFTYEDPTYGPVLDEQFRKYTSPLDLALMSKNSTIAADFGAGSGRWAERLLPYVKHLFVVEPSTGAFEVLKRKFENNSDVSLLNETIDSNSVPINSLDLAISLGVLHHIPNTSDGLADICEKIKPGGTLLCYLYYNLENRRFAYRMIFTISSLLRKVISRSPNIMKTILANIIALSIYFPLAKISKFLSFLRLNVQNMPLHQYMDMPLYFLRNDALDRFGTRLEHRFSRNQILQMLKESGFDTASVIFSNQEPFYTFAVRKIS
jgi:SAM-dependent methyltransferase